MIDIQALADEKGIARTYLDATNKLVTISEQSRKNVLEILGYPVDSQDELQKVLDKEAKEPFKNVLDPVLVLNDDDLKQFYIRVPETFGEDENATLTVSFKLEDGRTIERTVALEEVLKLGTKHIPKLFLFLFLTFLGPLYSYITFKFPYPILHL